MHIRIFAFTALHPATAQPYTFDAWQLPGGEVMVPQAQQTYDRFYDSLDAVQAQDTATITGYAYTGTTLNVWDIAIKKAARRAVRALGIDAMPVSLRALLRP